MLDFKLVYSDGYDLNLGAHVFPSEKYRLIHDRLLRDGLTAPADFVEPEPATDDQILLAHSHEWVQKLKLGTLTYMERAKLEIPYSAQVVKAFWLATGGTILSARSAVDDRLALNIGGGFHHAFPDHGEGFCAVNDVAVAVRVLQTDGAITRAMVVDCDVHHGNGTAAIFAEDATVFTFSIHQFNNYPSEKPQSTIDIHLRDGVADEEYLSVLTENLLPALDDFRPELLMYVAGADPYEEDQLGGLDLTMKGLKDRDRLVLDAAIAREIPVAIVLAGGYAQRVEDTVTIHCNTVRAAAEALNLRAQSKPMEVQSQ